jgi:hypothetical protein
LNCHAVSTTVNLTYFPQLVVTLTVSGDTLTTYNSGPYRWYFDDTLLPGDTSSVLIAQNSGNYFLQVIDSNNCPLTSGLETVTGAGIAGPLPDNAMAIYPNPSTGTWRLMVNDRLIGSAFEIYNAVGQQIYKAEITGSLTEISLPAAASGVYELRILSNNYRAVKKLVKE